MSVSSEAAADVSRPAPGALVRVRGQRWVVGAAVSSSAQTLVELNSIEDGRYGETLCVVWDVEPDARVIDAGALPVPGEFDPPSNVAAFLDAARWAAVSSADIYHLQAPFRSGAFIEDYQLEPLARALLAPRVNLLLADDVGLGKTIEAGLVALELLLRHRARSILIVCPAGLTSKWQQEMDEKFGLDFTIVDAAECARLRRVRGSSANPFRSHQLMIVSLPWLRTARAQRLLDEVLPAEVDPRHRTFDLLILDEAHHVAPAAPRQRYAVDSQQTKLIRRLTPHCEHRLFLTATPHNGYRESFTALLELVDDQRFARGAAIDRVSQREVVIRRLKRDVKRAEDEAFLPRETKVIEVDYTPDELRAYDLLDQFVQLRRRERAAQRKHPGRRTDVVALLLKKRLYSSPAAFAATVDVVRTGLDASRNSRLDWADAETETEDAWADASWADEFIESFDERDTLSDEDREAEENAALRRAEEETSAGADESASAHSLLEQMAAWALPYAHRPDTKAKALIDYLTAICRPGKEWLNERVVVFTEYRDTQVWLEDLLRREGLTIGHRVALLHGGMPPDERDRLRQEFQADPAHSNVRILIATDAAAEGIDLHWHCHRLVNYDVPFNPNRLEQRIGRIDRYGQQRRPEIRHFVAAGWEAQSTSTRTGFAGDLDFLGRIAKKISEVEADLGAVNPVLAEAVLNMMLGRPVDMSTLDHAGTGRRRLASDADVREQVARLRAQLDATIADLEITPDRVRRVVQTGLRLARQAPLERPVDPDDVWEVPPLTGTWVRATERLAHPLQPEALRPITFDQQVAKRRREDVVYAHLNHPLVAMSSRLMTAAASSGQVELHRTTALVGHHSDLTDPVAVAYARFLVVGGDAIRLHEELLYAGGWIRPRASGAGSVRFTRLESLGQLAAITAQAMSEAELPSPAAEQQLTDEWPAIERGLVSALDWRVRTRSEQVRRQLQTRRQAELQRNSDNFDRFAATLAEHLDTEPPDLLSEAMLTEEEAQLQRDRAAAQVRLEALPRERADEADRIRERYTDITEHTFPLAVIYVVPEGWPS